MHVLLADSDPRRAAEVACSVLAAGVQRLSRPEPGETLLEAVFRLAPDAVIVHMRFPDRDALDALRQVSERQPRPIAMFTDRDDPELLQQAVAAGVSSYHVVGADLPDARPILQAAIAIFERFSELERGRRRAEACLRDRVAIDRAKAMLIRTRACSEPEAYRWLRRQAMRQSRRIAEVATELVEKGQCGLGVPRG